MSTELLEISKPQASGAPVGESVAEVPASVTPAKLPKAPGPNNGHREDEEEPGFFRRFRVVLGVGAVALAGAVYALSGPATPSAPAPARKAAVPINVQLPPPPLPPPPPPPPAPKIEQPKEEVMEEQAPVVDEAPPEPVEDSPPAIGTNITGNGPADGFGLGKASGNGNGSGKRVGGGGGSKFGYYAAQVQNSVSSSIRRHSKTRSASLTVVARIWVDETGRVTRATLSGTSGDPSVDNALTNEVLTGLQLQSPPPAGMKMPINLRLTARAPR